MPEDGPSDDMRQRVAEASEALRRLLDAAKRGELTAPPGYLARLDGAALALEALADERSGER